MPLFAWRASVPVESALSKLIVQLQLCRKRQAGKSLIVERQLFIVFICTFFQKIHDNCGIRYCLLRLKMRYDLNIMMSHVGVFFNQTTTGMCHSAFSLHFYWVPKIAKGNDNTTPTVS